MTRRLLVRDATADDAAEACDVIRRSIIVLCTLDHHDDPAALAAWLENKTVAHVRSWITGPGGSVLVAEDGDKILAVGAVTDGGEITLNYVAPAARFAGVSKAVLTALERRAADRGNATIHLRSTATARRFYLSAGYRPDGDLDTAGRVPGDPMSKPLDDGA